ncbi:hypothetical protein MKW94_024514, partial [Papaver nudicaule]|nr:hypothetical protein [Papaver nudicaule]
MPDEVSMERSKNFVKALQELKSLKPQLYSAADYCEKSYQNSDQKQMVLDNLKDYAVRALVNVVDHLGTVAYKLTDLFEQQTLDVSTMEINISCLNQKLNTCQTYSKEEGLRQHQLYTTIPIHHKHYILPSMISGVYFLHLQLILNLRLLYNEKSSTLQSSSESLAKENSTIKLDLIKAQTESNSSLEKLREVEAQKMCCLCYHKTCFISHILFL